MADNFQDEADEAGCLDSYPPAPRGRIDSHVHVFDPVRFPYAPDAWYRPIPAETATYLQLGHVLDAHGIGQALLVGPNSGYQYDNRCLLAAIAEGRGRYRGVAVVRSDASREELLALREAGVVGIAFQVQLFGVDHYRDIGPLLERLRETGLWAQMQVEHDQLIALQPMLEASGARLIFDHCGRPDPARGIDQPGFQALLALGRSGRAAVKLSALVKCSRQPYPHEDAWPFVQALVDAFGPGQLVWASDWPFLRAPARIDYGPVMTLFERLVPNAALRSEILCTTPRRLFGFTDWEIPMRRRPTSMSLDERLRGSLQAGEQVAR